MRHKSVTRRGLTAAAAAITMVLAALLIPSPAIANQTAGPAAGPWANRSLVFSEQFSRTQQGVGAWTYEDWDGASFAPMSVDASFRAWRGRSNYALVGWNGSTSQHPGDATDTSLTFIAPVSGSIRITGAPKKRDTNGGDGVQARIVSGAHQIWPSQGWTSVAFNDATGPELNEVVDVRRGDHINFILNRQGNINNDSTWWNPTVTYLTSPAPAEPKISGVLNGTRYAPGVRPTYAAPDGAKAFATLSRDGGPGRAFRNEQPIAFPGRYELAVTAQTETGGRTFESSKTVTFAVGNADQRIYSSQAAFDGRAQLQQGWSYEYADGSQEGLMRYSIPRQRWESPGSAGAAISASAMVSTSGASAVRAFTSPLSSSANVSGDAHLSPQATHPVRIKVTTSGRQVWPTSGDGEVKPGQTLAMNFRQYLYPGQILRFSVDGDPNAGPNDRLQWSPTVTFDQNELLHFAPDDGYMGDAHPFFVNGKFYMPYLRTDGTFSSTMASSPDLLNWQPQSLSHTGDAPAAQPYYLLGILQERNVFRSWYGNGTHMRSSASSDLTTWKDGGREYDIPTTTSIYAAGARDPYVFWDPDVSRYRMVSSAYRANQDYGIGSGIDASIALTTSSTSDLTGWGATSDLIRFRNDDRPLSQAIDPEVTQMFKLGDRWYLMSSLARQSVHGVGRPTYWVGEPNTPIDQDNWASKIPQVMDGEDLCAAQVVQRDGEYLLMGWIPQDPNGNAFGGHLSLPRLISQRPDGSLGTSLDPHYASSLKGDTIWPSAGQTVRAERGAWMTGDDKASAAASDFSVAEIPARADRVDIKFTVDMSATASRSGMLLGSKTGAGPLGVEVTLDKQSGVLRIRQDRSGSGDWQEYSSLVIPESELHGSVHVRAVVEANIIELFVNDAYTLVGRVPFDLSQANIQLLSVSGPTTFSSIHVEQLDAPTIVGTSRS